MHVWCFTCVLIGIFFTYENMCYVVWMYDKPSWIAPLENVLNLGKFLLTVVSMHKFEGSVRRYFNIGIKMFYLKMYYFQFLEHINKK
jgi:hypothetical protein